MRVIVKLACSQSSIARTPPNLVMDDAMEITVQGVESVALAPWPAQAREEGSPAPSLRGEADASPPCPTWPQLPTTPDESTLSGLRRTSELRLDLLEFHARHRIPFGVGAGSSLCRAPGMGSWGHAPRPMSPPWRIA